MPSARQRFGQAAEERAVEFLRRKNFIIHGQHLTSRFGEIDILAQDGQTMVAVEVKARRTATFGRAIESLTPQKLERLAAALHDVLDRRGWSDRPIRIDLVTVEPQGLDHLLGIGPG